MKSLRNVVTLRVSLALARRPLARASRIWSDRRGIVAMAMALLFVPAVMVIGAAVDYARLEQFKTQLQSTVDSAALSGAAAYVGTSDNTNAIAVADNYLSSNEALLPPHIGTVTANVTAAQVTSGSNQGYTVTVQATGKIATTFMRLITSTLNVSATAVAVNPLVTITLTANNFKSSAYDANTLWYWEVAANDTTAVPDATSFAPDQKLASNTTTANSTVTITMTATQQIGIALQNVTGEVGGWYGCTQYQVASGMTTQSQCYLHTQWFFSNIFPPSNDSYNPVGYQVVSGNCSLITALTSSMPTSLTPPYSGSCFSSLPTDSTFSCSSLNGQYLTFYWNDMGGLVDDHDYNDAEITVSCSGIAGTGNSATNVYLSQ